MDVVRHQAVGENLQAVPLRVSLQQFQIAQPIFIVKEHIGPAIAPLRDVVRKTGGHHPGYSRHEVMLRKDCRKVK